MHELYLKYGKISYLINKLEESEKKQFTSNVNKVRESDCLFQNVRSKRGEFEDIVNEYVTKGVLLDQWDDHLNNWCSITESLHENHIKFQISTIIK